MFVWISICRNCGGIDAGEAEIGWATAEQRKELATTIGGWILDGRHVMRVGGQATLSCKCHETVSPIQDESK